MSLIIITAAALAGCTVTDGDTIRCNGERIRLLGVDAPDGPGNSRCRPVPKPGAVCDRQRAAASKASLQRIMTGPLSIERVGTDPYGRTLAMVYAQGRSLSCQQIEAGQATYFARGIRVADSGMIPATIPSNCRPPGRE
ncbi:thermonuclease family protein [Novosphingobium sp. BL-52-GroH]|uniref:thermonuclease family protein n=1 Tax=Novosphingobium sp. BL-52-GroH TaxID=3349877 RepID=UPI00384E89A5